MNNQLSHYISIEPDSFQELEGEFGVKITVNFALHHLPFFNRNDNAAVILQLRAFSTGILSVDFSAEGTNTASPVDIDFEPIDPERIYARKFSAIERLCDIEASISKTEDAEQRHQMILQDICRYFLRIGITPQQSSSIDLAFQKDNQFVIFEIKTTTPENLGQQAGKGSFQLALYSHGMAISGLAVARRILILEISTNELRYLLGVIPRRRRKHWEKYRGLPNPLFTAMV